MSDKFINKTITNFQEDDIPWPEGRHLYNLWQQKSKDGKLPARADFNPNELKSILPYIALVDIQQEPLDISIRLVGSYITNISKTDKTGQKMDIMADRYTWLIENKKPYFLSKIVPEWAPVDYRDYNILTLPLAADGETVNMAMSLIMPYEYEE